MGLDRRTLCASWHQPNLGAGSRPTLAWSLWCCRLLSMLRRYLWKPRLTHSQHIENHLLSSHQRDLRKRCPQQRTLDHHPCMVLPATGGLYPSDSSQDWCRYSIPLHHYKRKIRRYFLGTQATHRSQSLGCPSSSNLEHQKSWLMFPGRQKCYLIVCCLLSGLPDHLM